MRKTPIRRRSSVGYRLNYSMSSQLARMLTPQILSKVRRWEMVSLRR